jgi:hypothetical protein
MNYFKMFKDAGIIDNDANFIKQSYFDIDKNCQKSLEALFGLIEDVYTFNDFTIDLYDFSIELKNLYTEVGVNLGCLFIERHFNKEFLLNFCDNNKLEMKKILNLNGYLDIIFKLMGDIMIKSDIENLFPRLQNEISLLQHDLILENGVTKAAINFVLNSAEFGELSYFLIQTGFKCGFFWCLAYNSLYMQLSEEVENYIPVDLQMQLI